jgi:ribosomal protein L35
MPKAKTRKGAVKRGYKPPKKKKNNKKVYISKKDRGENANTSE